MFCFIYQNAGLSSIIGIESIMKQHILISQERALCFAGGAYGGRSCSEVRGTNDAAKGIRDGNVPTPALIETYLTHCNWSDCRIPKGLGDSIPHQPLPYRIYHQATATTTPSILVQCILYSCTCSSILHKAQ